MGKSTNFLWPWLQEQTVKLPEGNPSHHPFSDWDFPWTKPSSSGRLQGWWRSVQMAAPKATTNKTWWKRPTGQPWLVLGTWDCLSHPSFGRFHGTSWDWDRPAVFEWPVICWRNTHHFSTMHIYAHLFTISSLGIQKGEYCTICLWLTVCHGKIHHFQ